ncbi:VOC family protein [Streptomyces diastatochromogenes]|uniref:VOC family protein n=1 Tax=Streptomyces diastatochromogenes TaxID=42236 RepID=UPI003681C388
MVLDCSEPTQLAQFYQALLGGAVNQEDRHLDRAQEQVLALGARMLDDGSGGRSWRVYADPAGHPFCLVRH